MVACRSSPPELLLLLFVSSIFLHARHLLLRGPLSIIHDVPPSFIRVLQDPRAVWSSRHPPEIRRPVGVDFDGSVRGSAPNHDTNKPFFRNCTTPSKRTPLCSPHRRSLLPTGEVASASKNFTLHFLPPRKTLTLRLLPHACHFRLRSPDLSTPLLRRGPALVAALESTLISTTSCVNSSALTSASSQCAPTSSSSVSRSVDASVSCGSSVFSRSHRTSLSHAAPILLRSSCPMCYGVISTFWKKADMAHHKPTSQST